jgi:hypothetical protein
MILTSCINFKGSRLRAQNRTHADATSEPESPKTGSFVPWLARCEIQRLAVLKGRPEAIFRTGPGNFSSAPDNPVFREEHAP